MNSKELIKKIDIGRVGNGTQTYNDMCLILNKEETLELLQYIEQLEKENKELKEKLEKTIDELLEHEQKTFRKYAKCKRALDILKEVVSLNCDKNLETERQFLRLSQEEYELLKEVLDCE